MAEIARDALYRLARYLPEEGMSHDQVTAQLERMDPHFREYMVEAKLADGRRLWVRNSNANANAFPPEASTDPGLRSRARLAAAEAKAAPPPVILAPKARPAKVPPSSPLTAPVSLVFAGGMLIAGALGVYFTSPSVWKPDIGLPLSFVAIGCGAAWAISVRVLQVQARREASRQAARESLRHAEKAHGG
jgi:hypothetical protein